MSDSRTPEQRKADDALTEAIQGALKAFGAAQDLVLTEYIVIASSQGFDEDGDGLTGVSYLSRDSDVPIHRALGLLDYVAARLRARAMADDDE